jgi:hypothetical protein
MERLARHRTAHLQEAHGRRAACLGLQVGGTRPDRFSPPGFSRRSAEPMSLMS